MPVFRERRGHQPSVVDVPPALAAQYDADPAWERVESEQVVPEAAEQVEEAAEQVEESAPELVAEEKKGSKR